MLQPTPRKRSPKQISLGEVLCGKLVGRHQVKSRTCQDNTA